MDLSNTLGNLAKNKLFAQYLSATGAAMASPHPYGTSNIPGALNKVTQQNIAAQNANTMRQKYIELLSHALANGGKVNIGGGNVNATVPNTALDTQDLKKSMEGFNSTNPNNFLGDLIFHGANPPMQSASTASSNDSAMLKSLLSGAPLPNPPSSSAISPSDLAGLTPTDVGNAFNSAVAYGGLKSKLTPQPQAQAPMSVPGLGSMTLNQWKALPTDTKAYSYYAYDSQNRGEPVLPFDEWKHEVSPTSIQQIYDLAKKDPGFNKFYFASKHAGAPHISIGQKAIQQSKVAGRKYFSTNWTGDIQKYANSKAFRETIDRTPIKDATRKKYEMLEKYIDGKIKSYNGETLGKYVSPDKHTWTWKVKWPDGTTQDVIYELP